MTIKKLKTVMLLNSEIEAKELISYLTSNLEVFIAQNMDQFTALISNQEIECFIFERKYDQYPINELVDTLKNSERYGETPIILIADTIDLSLNVDLIITRPFNSLEIISSIKQLTEKSVTTIIPEHYNVLILDNSPEMLSIMSEHMREFKHDKFQLCASVAEAKNLINKQDFDILLLDWNLDDGTCIDVIQFVRSKTSRKRLMDALVVVITGRNSIDDIMTLLKYDVKDHIIKPFDHAELEDKLAYAIGKHVKSL